MGQDYQKTKVWTPRKCFSTDRVFRNETLDATHLAEFHQVEGFIADKGLGVGHLIGLFKEFFARIGISNLKFKPAYNPYTEPSMEIFGFHPGLNKWIEIGNSGVFRPEMLLPMGLPEDVRVIAWGLSVERPTMLLYGISNIRELFGAKMDVSHHKVNPVAWYRDARRTEKTDADKQERWLPGS
jgi:phenylalanyl-tRNA synthetase alpha chain